MRDAHELEDEIDDAAHEAEAAHRKRAKDAAKLQSAPKPLDQGGGMWVNPGNASMLFSSVLLL